jgi:hypothetical protein
MTASACLAAAASAKMATLLIDPLTTLLKTAFKTCAATQRQQQT